MLLHLGIIEKINNMIIDNLTTEQLIRVAKAFSFDKWKQTFPSEKWKGFDLVGENYIFQLGYEEELRKELEEATNFLPNDETTSISERVFYYKENLKEIQLSILQEEKIRKTLNLL